MNSLKRNAFFNIVYNIINVIFPLVSIAYVSHVLHATGVGRVSFAQNVTQYFVLLAPLGILNYGTKKIAGSLNGEQRNKIFSELFLINAISTSICVCCYYSLILFHNYFNKIA